MNKTLRKALLLERCRKGDSKAMLKMSEYGDAKIANMWLVRAVLYGNEEAREILRCNPSRASDTLIPIENFIPGKSMVGCSRTYSAEELLEIGFDNLPNLQKSYLLMGLSNERVLLLATDTEPESPGKDVFGDRTYYNYYTYDEFFHRISKKTCEDNPIFAYGLGVAYFEAHKHLPDLRIDWLVEDGIIKI